MIAKSESAIEDIGSGPDAVERDQFDRDHNQNLLLNEIDVCKRLAEQQLETLKDRDRRIADLQAVVSRQKGAMDAHDSHIQELKKALSASTALSVEWNRQQLWSKDIAEWILDQAFDEQGNRLKYTVDAAIADEDFVPGTIRTTMPDRFGELAGQPVKMQLVASIYEVSVGGKALIAHTIREFENAVKQDSRMVVLCADTSKRPKPQSTRWSKTVEWIRSWL